MQLSKAPWALATGTLVALVTGYVVWRTVKKRLLYDLHKIPGPPGWPILGNLPDMIGPIALRSHQFMAELTEKFGPLIRMRVGPTSILLVTDPVEVATLTSNHNRQDNLPKLKEAYFSLEFRAPHYSLLGTPDAEEWKSYRKTLNPAFSGENIRKAYPKILSIVEQAADVLQQFCKQGPVDIAKLSARMTAEIIGCFAFDEELQCLRLQTGGEGQLELAPQQFVQDTRAQLDWAGLMSSSLWEALLYFVMPWLEAPRQAKATMKRVRLADEAHMQIPGLHGYACTPSYHSTRQQASCSEAAAKKEDSMAAAIQQRGVQPPDNTALWACLGRLVNYKTGEAVCHDSLAANVGLLFTAGYETTAHLVNWALFELAANTDIQDQVRQELQEAGLAPTPQRPHPRALEFADLSRLSFLDAVVKETLRLHATAPNGSVRQVNRDMVIGGYRVPKGTLVQLPSYPMHLSSANFIKPLTFWPERWSKHPEASDHEHPDATPVGNQRHLAASWNPFSCGPRNCIGQTLALAEARTTLAVFVAKFAFELPMGVNREAFLRDEQVTKVTLQPKGELMLRVRPVSGHAVD